MTFAHEKGRERRGGKTVGPLLSFLLERLTLAAIAALVAAAVFVVIGREVYAGATHRLDSTVLHYFLTHRIPAVQRLMAAVSWMASDAALGAVALLCALRAWRTPASRPDALSMLIALAGGEGVIVGLKALFHRPRPAPAFANLGYSFPSGHAFFAVIIYGMLTYWLTRKRPQHRGRLWAAALALIFLIGFSRVYLGVHFPSDVAAGFAAALPWLWGCLALPKALGRLRRTVTT